jgi:hypothetical protein
MEKVKVLRSPTRHARIIIGNDLAHEDRRI